MFTWERQTCAEKLTIERTLIDLLLSVPDLLACQAPQSWEAPQLGLIGTWPIPGQLTASWSIGQGNLIDLTMCHTC